MDRFELDKKLESLRLSCVQCTGDTWHTVMTAVLHNYDDENSYHRFEAHTAHQIVQCNGCKTISYRSSSTNSEDYDYDEHGNLHHPATVKLFPPRLLKSIIEEVDLYSIPNQTRGLLLETRSALANQQNILAGIGLRGLIETVVKEKRAAGRDLQKQIDDLVEKRLLTPGRAEILHQIRSIGNDAAHEAHPHTAEQLNLALEVIEHVLQEVYVLPEKAVRVFTRAAHATPPALPATPGPAAD